MLISFYITKQNQTKWNATKGCTLIFGNTHEEILYKRGRGQVTSDVEKHQVVENPPTHQNATSPWEPTSFSDQRVRPVGSSNWERNIPVRSEFELVIGIQSESELNFPFWERNGSRAMLLMSLTLYGLLFFSLLNLISDFTSSYISTASEVVQMICLFPLLGSCASFVSAASEAVQVIGLSRCLRSCAGNWNVAVSIHNEDLNTISIEFPYDVLYDSNSGQKKRQWSTNK
ncbi:hypothetical protein H5410_033475 [Solanum commersonii]|uniref:Uncharacterized protein n=1 Tax=Solanum commersonii TaxID=4109 RepID=A0A9J5YNS9_SOLCO|nr:hypothetical protein H5410_033475 [Solanum commersonii]